MSRNHDRMQMLLRLAEKENILVEFIRKDSPKNWFGLYVRTISMGSSIALRSDLDSAMMVWVFAHELAHNYNRDQTFLFSPFKFPVSTNKSVDLAEESADREAIKLLTKPEEWTAAVGNHPTCLKRIVAELELPIEAGVSWERLKRDECSHDQIARVEFSPSLWEELDRRVAGQGGAQHTYKKMLDYRRGNNTVLSSYDFSLVRERAATMRGGWGGTFKKVAKELEGQIRASGGIACFFTNNVT